jgi:hypothetical protein
MLHTAISLHGTCKVTLVWQSQVIILIDTLVHFHQLNVLNAKFQGEEGK